METFVTVIHVFAALFMILVVLVQGGNSGGVSAAFGGGNTQGVFGATGATTFLGKLTYGAAAVFIVTTVSLTVLQGKGREVGLGDKLEEAAQTSAPAEEAATAEKAAEPEEKPAAPAAEAKEPAAEVKTDAAPKTEDK